jgi:AraC-like DNA-binding protein
MPAGPVRPPHTSHQSNSPPPELPAATKSFAPEVFSRGGLRFWFQQVSPNYFLPHSHPEAQIAIGYGVRKGEFQWREGNRTVEQEAGGDLVWFLPGNSQHSLRLRRRAFWIVFYLHPGLDIARDVTVRATLGPLSDYVRRDGLIGSLGSALRDERSTERIGNPGHVLNISALLGSCLLRAHTRETTRGHPQLALPGDAKERLRQYVVTHLRDPLPLTVLARAAGMGADYFSRRLRFTTGFSAEQFVLHERLNHAQGLLRTGQHPVEKVAELCGFPSHTTMTKHFSVRFGRPPRSYLPAVLRF